MYQAGETLDHIRHFIEHLTRAKENVASLSHPSQHQEYNLSDLALDAQEMRRRAVALIGLYDGQKPQPALEQLLIAVSRLAESIGTLFDRIKEHSCRSYFVPRTFLKIWWQVVTEEPIEGKEIYEEIANNLHRLYTRFLHVLDVLSEFTLKAMPIALSDQTVSRITYEQVRQSPQSAMQLAFALFEEHLRQRIGAGPELYGESLINAALGVNGCLVYGEVAAEQTGLRNLVSGFYATFRNPRMHRILEDSETSAHTVIALVDLLMQIVNEAQDR